MNSDAPFNTVEHMLWAWEKIWGESTRCHKCGVRVGIHPPEYDMVTTRPVSTVIDIGACHGAFSLWAASRWPDSDIFAWEPSPEAYELLKANLAHLPGVLTHNAAVLDKDADPTLELSIPKANIGASTLHFNYTGIFADIYKVDVKVTPACELPDCDVLKLDCEGSELRVLREYLHDDKRNRLPHAVLYEFHSEELARELLKLLPPLGYRLMQRTSYSETLGVDKWRLER